MLRAALTIGGTVAGLAALLSFRTHTLAATAPDAASTPAASTGMAQPAASGTRSGSGTGSGSATPAAGKAGTAPGATPKASASTVAATRTVTGSVANTQYGPMQVQLTLVGTKITNVNVLQRTNDGSESDQIDATAIPKLTSETLVAQSASIQAVSGASYTSSGYIQSLQSALDKARG